MFARAAAGFACAIRLLLDAAARRFDAGPRTGADLHAAHDDGACQLAVAKDLCRTLPEFDNAGFRQRLTRYFRAFGHRRDVVECHDLRLYAERVGEATLRDAARERHLAALEARLAAARPTMASARHGALVTLAGRLALAGAQTAAKALAIAMRSRRRREVVKSDLLLRSHAHHSFTGVTVTRWRTLFTWPRSAAESLWITDCWW